MSSAHRINLSDAETAPVGAVKWKALFDNGNPLTSKILLRSTHTEELIPWYGFGSTKDFVFTNIPLTKDQNEVVKAIEGQLAQLLQRQSWSESFKVVRTEKIFPRYGDCTFYEKKEDGCLYRTEPDVGLELRSSVEKSLDAAALLQVTGVFFDYSKHLAKLTFKLVSLVYQWADANKSREDICVSYMSMYGKLADSTDATADVVEAAVKAAGLDSAVTETGDKEKFLASLFKIRTVNGVRKKINKLRRDSANEVDRDFMRWAEEQGLKHSFALKAKANKEEEKKREQLISMMKPLQQQQQQQQPQSQLLQQQQQQQPQSQLLQQQQQDTIAHHSMDMEIFDTDDEISE
jgi:hypothetical protein